MEKQDRIWAIIVAAGVGNRLPGKCPKQYRQLADKTVLEHSVSPFLSHPQIVKTVVVISAQDRYWQELPIAKADNILVTHGGKERFNSVLAGLMALEKHATATDWVLTHDAARPCLRKTDLAHLISTLYDHPVGGILAAPVRDTLKKAQDVEIVATIPRENMWCALTPQMFRYNTLRKALESAEKHNQVITDEAAAIELLGERPMLVKGSNDNIKITFEEDLAFAQAILQINMGK